MLADDLPSSKGLISGCGRRFLQCFGADGDLFFVGGDIIGDLRHLSIKGGPGQFDILLVQELLRTLWCILVHTSIY